MKRRLQKVLVIVIMMAVTAITAFGAGATLGSSNPFLGPPVALAASQPPQFSVFWQAWDLVQQHFVDRSALDTTQLTYGAIRGMIQALGDEGHTIFLTPEELTLQRTDISGKFTGIGAQLGIENMLPVIVAPFDGSPAAQAGVEAGDIILEVDGEDVTTLPLNEIVSRIRGPEETEVVLTVLHRDAGQSEKIAIVRGEIDVPAATWAMVPDTSVALIRLSQFSADARQDIISAIKGAEAAGATGLIVDVRNNPGGLLQQAIGVTSQFLTEGNVLQQEDANGQRQIFPVESGGIATDIPLVVLINRGSASSSEIFAGAIQDHQRGKVVGETTFGTGTVLEPFVLDDGSALMLGTSQWLTANGRLIRQHGIEPDLTVTMPLITDLVMPVELENMSKSDVLGSDDKQFLKALELLDALPAYTASVAEPASSR